MALEKSKYGLKITPGCASFAHGCPGTDFVVTLVLGMSGASFSLLDCQDSLCQCHLLHQVLAPPQPSSSLQMLAPTCSCHHSEGPLCPLLTDNVTPCCAAGSTSALSHRYLDTLEQALAAGELVLIENLEESVDPVLGPLLGRETIKKGR